MFFDPKQDDGQPHSLCTHCLTENAQVSPLLQIKKDKEVPTPAANAQDVKVFECPTCKKQFPGQLQFTRFDLLLMCMVMWVNKDPDLVKQVASELLELRTNIWKEEVRKEQDYLDRLERGEVSPSEALMRRIGREFGLSDERVEKMLKKQKARGADRTGEEGQ